MANMLQPVESHIRVGAHLENVDLTPTSLRFICPNAPNKAFTATRVHRTPMQKHPDEFYQEAIRKCVINAHAGQSTTILVSGPSCSGRSQTLYGNEKEGEKGIIELAAAELLSLRGALVSFCGYSCRGNDVFDTMLRGHKRVELADYAPPIGTVALAHMRTLKHPREALLLPSKKTPDTSCVVSFQVYRPIDRSEPRRDAFATLTFVDVAAFGAAPHPSDLVALNRTLDALRHGGDPQFKQCALTRILEPALVGSTTLVSVATVTGRQQFLEPASDCLEFTEKLGRLNKMLTLIQLQVPPQLKAAVDAHEHDVKRERAVLEACFEAGVRDSYNTMRKFMVENFSVDNTFDHLLQELAVARQNQASQAEERLRKANHALQSAQTRNEAAIANAQRSNARLRQLQKEEAQLKDDCARLELDIEAEKTKTATFVSECDLELARVEAENTKYHRFVADAERETARMKYDTEQIWNEINQDLEQSARNHRYRRNERELEDLAHKKKRLEEKLAEASTKVQRSNAATREARERKSRMHRATNIHARVTCLRQTISRSSMPTADGASSHYDPSCDRAGSNMVHERPTTESPVPIASAQAIIDELTANKAVSKEPSASSKSPTPRKAGTPRSRKRVAVVSSPRAARQQTPDMLKSGVDLASKVLKTMAASDANAVDAEGDIILATETTLSRKGSSRARRATAASRSKSRAKKELPMAVDDAAVPATLF